RDPGVSTQGGRLGSGHAEVSDGASEARREAGPLRRLSSGAARTARAARRRQGATGTDAACPWPALVQAGVAAIPSDAVAVVTLLEGPIGDTVPTDRLATTVVVTNPPRLDLAARVATVPRLGVAVVASLIVARAGHAAAAAGNTASPTPARGASAGEGEGTA